MSVIQMSLLHYMDQTKYTVKMCKTWPLIGPKGKPLSIRKIAEDLKLMYCDDKRSTEGVVNKLIRTFIFEFAWADNTLERKSISKFEDIIKKQYIDYNAIDDERQNEICKQFYTKLPKSNHFTDMFVNQTLKRAKRPGKKLDNIDSMLTRLNYCLAKCRAIVENAHGMGGLSFRFATKLTLADMQDPDAGPATYKRLMNIDLTQATSGIARDADMCHTCGADSHNRYACPLFMNEHCNNTHCTWDESEAAADFRRIGHAQWKPNVHINGTITRYTSNPGAATYVYPTDDDPVDMGPVKSNTAPSYDYTKKNKNKNKHHHNNKNNNFNNRNNDRNNDRDNDRNNNRNNDRDNDRNNNSRNNDRDDRNNDRDNRNNDRDNRNNDRDNRDTGPRVSEGYKGKSKSTYELGLPPEIPLMSQLLSAIAPDNLKEFLQVYISLPQIQSQDTAQAETVTTTAKTTHATRRKKKTKIATAATTAPTKAGGASSKYNPK